MPRVHTRFALCELQYLLLERRCIDISYWVGDIEACCLSLSDQMRAAVQPRCVNELAIDTDILDESEQEASAQALHIDEWSYPRHSPPSRRGAA